jgi:hypothetical protein
MEIDELKIKNLGFIFIAIGIVLLLLSIYYVKSELFSIHLHSNPDIWGITIRL